MKNTYRSLNSLRAVSAVIIVLFHCHQYLNIHYLLPFGALATDIFFMLSGFGLTLKYAPLLHQGYPARRFLLQRAVKIFPIYWMGCAACILAFWLIPPTYLRPALQIRAVFLLPGLTTGEAFPLDPPAWFLFSLCVCYIVFACGLYKASVLSYAYIAVIGWLLYFACHNWTSGFDIAVWGTIRGLADFSAGAFLCHNRVRLIKYLPRIHPLIIGTLLLVLTAMPFQSIEGVYSSTFTLFLSPLIILLCLRTDQNNSSTDSSEWQRRLNALPYPLYISHISTIVLSLRLNSASPWSRMIFVLTFSILLATAIAALNVPVQKWLRARFHLQDSAIQKSPVEAAQTAARHVH